jgi:hypothetical protein
MWKNVLLAILAVALIVLIVLCCNASLLLSIPWPTITQLKTILNLLQSALTILALAVGAAWVYYNYLKGRTYQKRLQSEVSAEIVALNGQHHLLATLKLENVGLSNVVLKNSTALEVWAYETLGHVDDTLVLSEVRWGGIGNNPGLRRYGAGTRRNDRGTMLDTNPRKRTCYGVPTVP